MKFIAILKNRLSRAKMYSIFKRLAVVTKGEATSQGKTARRARFASPLVTTRVVPHFA